MTKTTSQVTGVKFRIGPFEVALLGCGKLAELLAKSNSPMEAMEVLTRVYQLAKSYKNTWGYPLVGYDDGEEARGIAQEAEELELSLKDLSDLFSSQVEIVTRHDGA